MNRNRRQQTRSGFTLLEVLLATVILASALTAVGQLASNGQSAALRAERESEAALICQSELDAILSGTARIDRNHRVRAVNDEWLATTTVSDGPTPTLAQLTIRVEAATGAKASFELQRIVSRKDVKR